jgi:predicted dithiol-disulfide oxidoreductase (DUF899 family)
VTKPSSLVWTRGPNLPLVLLGWQRLQLRLPGVLHARRTEGRKKAPGISVFLKEGERIFHTYSTYARGLDMLNVAYHYMDLVPKGRDEGDGGQMWVRRRDEYPD